MKFVCEKDNILKAINSVTKAVAVRTTMPILEGILIALRILSFSQTNFILI